MRALTVLTGLTLALCLSVPAFGASLGYDPNPLTIETAAGGRETASFTLTLENPLSGTYFVWVKNRLEGQAAGWVKVSPLSAFTSIWRPDKTIMLTIDVPQGTPPGNYQARLYSKAMSSHDTAYSGSGLLIEVIIPSEGCSGVPRIVITDFGPKYIIWSPNHSMEVVHVSGVVSLPGGCSLVDFGYSIEDEYGVYTGVGKISIAAGGSFTAYLPVEAWRYGEDKDGRHYAISIFAEDEAGIATSDTYYAIVPHDMREKKK